MNRENFIVRSRQEPVERFQKREVWDSLSRGDREILRRAFRVADYGIAHCPDTSGTS